MRRDALLLAVIGSAQGAIQNMNAQGKGDAFSAALEMGRWHLDGAPDEAIRARCF